MTENVLGRPAFLLGRAAQRLGAPDAARTAFVAASRLAPGRADYRLRAARLLQDAGRWEQSVAVCALPAEAAPQADARQVLELAWRRGLAATVVGDDAVAREAFADAVRLAPTSPRWRKLLAIELRELEAATAVRAYSTLTAVDPDQRRWRSAQAVAHEQLGEWEAAATVWSGLIARDASRPSDHYRLGRCYVRLGRPDDARVAIRAGLAVDPTRRPIDDQMLDGTPTSFRSRRLVSHFVEDHLDELRAAVAAREPSVARSEHGGASPGPHVFVYWAQGFDDAPPIVRRCLQQLRDLHGPDVVVALDDAGLGEWVHIPVDVEAVASATPTQYSDLVRTALLLEHGGVWVDATCFATRPLLDLEETRTDSGLFVFRYRPHRIASWFMVARPDDPVLATLYELQLLFWRRHDRVVSYFMFHDMVETLCHLEPTFRAEIESLPLVGPSWLLTRRMRDPYDAAGFEQTLATSFVHKLTYKQPEANTERGTYFAHLLAGGGAPRE